MALRTWRALRRAAVCISSGAALSVALAACNESLDGSAGCPLACGNVSPQIQTITLNGIALDTTVPADLGLGSGTEMLLSNRGDTLDTRVIARFDTLPTVTLTSSGSTTSTAAISFVDSAYLRLHFDTTQVGATVPVTISAYDVDTTAGNDTSVATLAPLFTPERFIGSITFPFGKPTDTASIAIPSAFMLGKIQAHKRLRIGLRISSTQSASARILSTETLEGPEITMRISQDNTIAGIALTAYSTTPVDDKIVAGNLADFTLLVIGTLAPPDTILAVGGLPVERTYFRFNLPSLIVDSAIIVRATLVLTQAPGATPDQADTMLVYPSIVVAGGIVTDPGRAAQIISSTLVTMEPLVTHPEDIGVKEIEIAPVFPAWAVQNETEFPRAIVLRSGQEALSPQQARFYSSEALDPSKRPQLRISYTLRTRVGAP
ncbi:MAG TPA: hypothetical protein VNU46_03205 [Gemmatimonadaceae bacterium]|jgi:hypothetical protein|nr:hypothetical protein [Gemmatimonadaceae bacterium]